MSSTSAVAAEQRRRWHLSRGISIDSLLAILGVVLLGAGAVANHEKRMTTIEKASEQHEKDDGKLYRKLELERAEMREDIKEIRRLVEEQSYRDRKSR